MYPAVPPVQSSLFANAFDVQLQLEAISNSESVWPIARTKPLCGIKSGRIFDQKSAMPTKAATALSADKEEI